jgi:gluconokinase
LVNHETIAESLALHSLSRPVRIVVMGVSGCGKSTFAKALERATGWAFVEGDSLHPPANIAAMKAGRPLDDADRAPWLDRVASAIDGWRAAGQGGIISCSALKRRYRDRLRVADPALMFVHLHADRDTLERRLLRRRNHFMPASLLASQFEALELPGADEHALTVSATAPVARTVAQVLRHTEALKPPSTNST